MTSPVPERGYCAKQLLVNLETVDNDSEFSFILAEIGVFCRAGHSPDISI